MDFLTAVSQDGEIITLDPGAQTSDGHYVVTTVENAVFEALWPQIAHAPVPLDTLVYDALRSIDRFWQMNAERWRSEGRI